MKTRQRFGALLSTFRARANLTRERLAELVLGNRKSRSLVYKWEAGDVRGGRAVRCHPPPSRFPALLSALALSPDETKEFLAAYAEETGVLPCHGLSRGTYRLLASHLLP